MTDINDLVQEFLRTSSNGDAEASLFEMRCLHDILVGYLEVSLYSSESIFTAAVDLADYYSSQPVLDGTEDRAKFKILLDGYRKMFDQSLSKSKDLGDMLRLLPGVVVQKEMSMQGMTDLYGIKPDLLECLIKSTIEPLRPGFLSRYKLVDYLSGFLEDRDRSKLYYCDPMFQHISICHHILSLLDGTNGLDPEL